MPLVLDPRISYDSLKTDYADDQMLSEHLENSKSKLFDYFNKNYAHVAISTPPSVPSPSLVQTPPLGSPTKSFTARYRTKEKAAVNELEEYFKLPAEDFDACNPIHWWMGRRAQFPNLFCLARDILSIPGKLFLHIHNLRIVNIIIFMSRFSCCCWAGLLRWTGHHLSPSCKPWCWNHPDSYACEEAVASGSVGH